MSDVLEVKVPDIGDFDAVDVVEVLVAAGDRVEKDDSLITLESDKATMDVPAPVAGTVQELRVKAGDQVHEGTAILTIELASEEEASADDPGAEADEAAGSLQGAGAPAGAEDEETPDESEAASREEPVEGPDRAVDEAPPAPAKDKRHPVEVVQGDFSRVYASPSVRHFARQLGVDLTRVHGSGRKGRILKEDVQAWVK